MEEHLTNLLTEHDSSEVKISAAKALGAFGEEMALAALETYADQGKRGEVRDAVEHAARRIRRRLSG